ncbi:MAG: MBL fold metallo-hydrolase [Anaerolineae bacterium]|nr:MBL fold metallo-hydrolase [Anaerolineae bacterium]
MASQWYDFGNNTYALIGGSNIGVMTQAGRAIMIDTGLDRDAARKALRSVEKLGAQLVAILITHGHADHFGGAGWLAGQANIPVYAPSLEGTFATHPILEPLFLYGGAAPISELRGKFTLARDSVTSVKPLTVGIHALNGFELNILSLPGHAPEQVGILYNGTFYCGDVVFPETTLAQHPILFCYDLDAWLDTLANLPTLTYTQFIAGHGEPGDNIIPLADATAARMREIRARVWEALNTPQESYQILRAVAVHYDLTFSNPSSFLLALTTIQAALTSLQKAGEAGISMKDNQMLWQRT